MPPISILTVTASPDDRSTTGSLRDVVAGLRRRHDARGSLWYLRDDDPDPRDADRVVDHLRTGEPGSALDAVGLHMVGSWARGRQLRRWLGSESPTHVLLDDGLGSRVLDGFNRPHRVLVRVNAELPVDVALEPEPRRNADILLVTPGADATRFSASRVLEMPMLQDEHRALTFADPAQRGGVRRRLGLPTDAKIVVGWGNDMWFDGPDLLVRAIWSLEHRHGASVHGLWMGGDALLRDRLSEEATRCGLPDRIHHVHTPSTGARLCGDAVFLPYRCEGELGPVRDSLMSGMPVVTFPVWTMRDPAIIAVRHLDVEAAATSILASFDMDRSSSAVQAISRHGVQPWIDRFLSMLSELD